jgi:8-oxo-dGTP pyrophosphatase MutT (NUDIX family)
VIQQAGMPAARQPQRVAARALLGTERAEVPVLHGEHPRLAARRAARQLTSDPLRQVGPPQVATALLPDPASPVYLLRFGYRFEPGPEPEVGAGDGSAPAAGQEPLPLVRPVGSIRPRPAVRRAAGRRGLPQVQRAAAYAVIVERGRLLLTRLTSSELWTLPGGGIEPGETPVEAAVREVYEEAGLVLAPGELLEVDSIHFTGQAPDGRWEDYHGIRVVYAGEVPAGLTPRVIEVGGTTEEAAWIGRDRLAALELSGLARTMITHELLAQLH